jgi:hypothetical protein
VIFSAIKPTLEGYAKRFSKTESAQELVSDFMGKAFLILRKFDEGSLPKKVEINGAWLPYDPSVHSKAQLYLALQKYLVKSFTFECIRKFQRNKRLLFIGDSNPDQFVTVPKAPKVTAEFVRASELIGVLNLVVAERCRGYTLSKIEGLFLKAFVNHLEQLVNNYGDFIALIYMNSMVRLTPDTKTDIKKSFIKELSRVLLQQEDPAVIAGLGAWLVDSAHVELAYKKILKYFREEFDIRRTQ